MATINNDYTSLQQALQRQSLTAMCNQYNSLIDWVRQYHADAFPTFQYQFKKPKSAFQPSWTQILGVKTTVSSTSVSSTTSATTKNLGKTRAYRTRSLVPGFCNNERTFANVYNCIVPKTPTNLYKRQNVNRDDRYFDGTNQTVRLFQLTQAEWIQHARECLKTPSTITFNKCEPLMTYIRYVVQCGEEKEPKESPPNIFGAKLTNDQKEELLDAYYWVHMKGDPTHKTVLFYYKLYGWFARVKDGYRSTKNHELRELNIKRQKLIAFGSLRVQPKHSVDANRLKSSRGRKPKQNV